MPVKVGPGLAKTIISEHILSLEDVKVAMEGLSMDRSASSSPESAAGRLDEQRRVLRALQAHVEARKGLEAGALDDHV